ncbi:hypothetical protein QZH56_15450 [Streptomyces olivoreticuli]|uniref:hypothetical protein n=1 Tax=Streptomyces olivoreticuli TaxID=68246 RepID=UPI002659FBF2|nr:hypothetical protein [Streptomyces olivoreticuli]WKK26862.1 hypothetical protein QZH56_15450 [Streptomyces olivoreticuli]
MTRKVTLWDWWIGKFQQNADGSGEINNRWVYSCLLGGLFAFSSTLWSIRSMPPTRPLSSDPRIWIALIDLCAAIAWLPFVHFSRNIAEKHIQQAADAIKNPLKAKVERLKISLSEAAQISDELSAELQTRLTTLAVMQAEAEQWENLASLRKEQAESVAQLVAAKVDRGVRHIDRMGWMFWVLGSAVAILVGMYAEYLVIHL